MNKYVYGIDVGGTNIKFGLFEASTMDLIDQREVETPKINHEVSIFECIHANISSLNEKNNLNMEHISGVGVAVPCPVKSGYVRKCPNLQWGNLDIAASLEKVLPKNINVVVSNDATIAAYGENMSLEKPYMNAVFYTLGTGVGGGIIIDGKILEGGTGLGGEIGHMHMFDDAMEDCGCGSRGCLEQICGTGAILNRTKEISQKKKTTMDLNNLTVKSIFDAAKADDEVALEVVNRVADYIAKSASILAVILDPEVFIIGGGISRAGGFLIDLIENHYKKYARFTTNNIPFILAKTGNNAGIIGAAYISNTNK